MGIIKNKSFENLSSVFTQIFIILSITSSLKIFSQHDYYFNHLNVNHGLSSNQVNWIYKDSKGFMWFGTLSGLNRFDGYTFKVYKHDIHDSTSISDNFVTDIFEDHFGRMWIGTHDEYNIFDPNTETFITASEDNFLDSLSVDAYYIDKILKDFHGNYWYCDSRAKLYKYDAAQKSFYRVFYYDSTRLASDMQISWMENDNKGDIWIVTVKGFILKLDVKSNKIVYINNCLSLKNGNNTLYYRLFIDNDNDLWINATNDALGVYFLNLKEDHLYHFTTESEIVKTNTNIVYGIVQDNFGIIWVVTDHGGINLINKNNFNIKYLLHDPNNTRSLSQNSITALYKDNTGIIWIGTFKKGICYYHEEIIKFKSYKHIPSERNSLIFDDVNCFTEDNKGNLWIGTNGGGLDYFNRKTGQFTHFVHDPDDLKSLSNNIIIDLYYDKNKILWIGTFYGGLNYYDGKRFYHFMYDNENPNSIADNRIWKIYEDSENNLWIGTLGSGLDRYDRRKNIFYHYQASDINSIGSKYITDIEEDDHGNIWFGTAHGISVLEKSSRKFLYHNHQPGNENSLSNDNITDIICDNRGYIWIGTREGLNIFDQNTNDYKVIHQADGLTDNYISTILLDDFNNVWIGTPNGISNIILHNEKFDSLKFSIKNYDESDGLQGKVFNQNASLKTRSGELIFGGANGFNIIQPEKIKMNKRIPDVVFTNFQIYNNEVNVNKKINGRIILNKAITETDHVTLKYHENMFTIGFTALNYFQPEKNKYKYRLTGFKDEWLVCDVMSRKVTYTNLDPGEYIFQVIASNNDGIWNEKGASLKIIILPPYWKTKWAFIIYIILIIGMLFLLRHMVLLRERLKYQAQQERQKAQRRHEVDLLKIKFFTNISHEFKTPLALIISPLEKIMKGTHDPGSKQQFQLIYRNARRLLTLVNQLLDFRRMEIQEIRLNATSGEIVSFVREILYSFTDLSEKKDIQLGFKTTVDKLNTYFDHDKVEKIVFNLLSNAFKFTPEKGNINVSIDLHSTENKSSLEDSSENMVWVVLKVKDSGIGIPKEKQEKIFIRFFQDDIPGTLANQGSGIGLSLVSEFVRLHKGKISVESEVGKGSIFTVMLPITKEPDLKKIKTTIKPEAYDNSLRRDKFNQPLPLVLIVEDNEDFRFYLKDNLKSNYNIIEASNGVKGLNLAKEFKPDLIVSDIKMPEMDGIELCRNIKEDKKISHIPIILLTAITSTNKKVKGFDYGADDYITKPFSFEILESRIKNLIAKHDILQKTLKKKIDITLSEIQITSKDEKLIQKALELVEMNISNPEFSVEELSKEIGMSRVHLYKKLLSLTGRTPIEFIRTVRLKRAAQLLEKSQMSVSEVAYKVGFNNPKYFTKYFKSEFKVLPSVYAAEKQKEQVNKKDFKI